MPPKPRSRPPRSALPPTLADLPPAPGNSEPYGAKRTPAISSQATRQLGTRISPDLYDQLVATSKATGISQTRLVTNALEVELAKHQQ